MNRIKHKFYTADVLTNEKLVIDDKKTLLWGSDCCIFCCKTIIEMCGASIIYLNARKYYEYKMNTGYPCLTEDEVMIKGLLE